MSISLQMQAILSSFSQKSEVFWQVYDLEDPSLFKDDAGLYGSSCVAGTLDGDFAVPRLSNKGSSVVLILWWCQYVERFSSWKCLVHRLGIGHQIAGAPAANQIALFSLNRFKYSTSTEQIWSPDGVVGQYIWLQCRGLGYRIALDTLTKNSAREL